MLYLGVSNRHRVCGARMRMVHDDDGVELFPKRRYGTEKVTEEERP